MKNNSIPEIRFTGFTDAWEQCEFKKVFDVHTDFVSNGSFQALKDNVKLYHTENYAYMIRLQDASNNWRGPWLYTDKKGFEFLNKSTVYENDILMSDRGTIGEFFLVPKLDKPMTLSSNAVLLRSSKNNNYFIYYLLNTKEVGNQIKMRTTPGVQPMISKTEFKKITAKFPRLNEQKRIGEFFSNLDHLITLHQRKLNNVKNLKTGLLQKMFPKNGEVFAEFRFPGFTDAWEQRRLGEMCVIGDIDHRMPDSVIDGIPYIMTGDFIGINGLDFENSKQVSLGDYEQLSQKIKPEQGDILFARYASVGTVRYVETLEKFLVSYSCAILKPDETINGKCLFYYLQSDACQQQIQLEINNGSQRNVGIDSLKKLKICAPSMKEQSLIAELLTHVDTLITLHQCELDALKKTKKAFLQKMFV
ncbi:Type I restriction-modification system S subunit [Actinobacillus pleuropneumoniae]|nr:Type I restriction-modification system S subunit [Actinobacillus pleuropneumoniae]